MDTEQFAAIAREAIEEFPDQIRRELRDVVIVIEETSAGRRGRGMLLGLYEGVPLTEWGRDYSGKEPDRITLFREEIKAAADGEEDIPRVIRETVWHEVGHYFGLDHDRIGPMEHRWKQRNRAKEGKG